MNVLIVEDYKKINDLLYTFASRDGYTTFQTYDAETAIEVLGKEKIDVILLDLMLPNMQGEAFISQIRSFSDVYIIVLSAKIDVENRVDVISIGADDYMTKPFSIDEVVAKLKNIQKRLVVNQPTRLSFNHAHLTLLPISREVYIDHQLITLTKHEYEILLLLAKHPNIVYTRDMIIEECFDDSEAYDRVIDVFIKNIRKKLDNKESGLSYIKTHYGIGYQFGGIKDE
ncbi:MAG: hypothetical protein A2Y45_08795 [Tenericutes bacterium GWC2_34_14]|nr:MAG: hypothetical protein A2Z84_04665 [Tenericutes bacterium GWA2_35_7]OHE29990.1 MAG: hypothetical protein A2Y45_08795 [Tenericutes bacterium GWC2_34_14]OHE34969.1 MAG: hypothetical protein A2012_02405 [Tenericutes bacterium GWE2_34_108]OHE37171.1 MAG: hypothetical protein A2Y46_00605 [Tenericutes bacterium GWF1_35_14]OHE39697.1 MAG: hypothetical protein A2Y44_02255 [Tenericutes bacterium GWF2_35_184]OHE44115.1 MAG: hypothetical protein A2221_03255 [Tenericutes bacterium RIFOXYA2_FULL_36_3